MKKIALLLIVVIAFTQLPAQEALVKTILLTRGPYLQMGNQTSVTLRWRTDIAANTKFEAAIQRNMGLMAMWKLIIPITARTT
ncbi:MAG: hypothetical protein WDO19_08410 [Bacteroidota bacterium]